MLRLNILITPLLWDVQDVKIKYHRRAARQSDSFKLLCTHCSFGFLFLLRNHPANNRGARAGCRNLSVLYTICFQLPHWVKMGGCGGGC